MKKTKTVTAKKTSSEVKNVEDTAAVYSSYASKAKAAIQKSQPPARVNEAQAPRNTPEKPKKKAKTRDGKRGILIHVPYEMGDALKRLAEQKKINLETLAFEALSSYLASHDLAPFIDAGSASVPAAGSTPHVIG